VAMEAVEELLVLNQCQLSLCRHGGFCSPLIAGVTEVREKANDPGRDSRSFRMMNLCPRVSAWACRLWINPGPGVRVRRTVSAHRHAAIEQGAGAGIIGPWRGAGPAPRARIGPGDQWFRVVPLPGTGSLYHLPEPKAE
jgi:hypothetical protein